MLDQADKLRSLFDKLDHGEILTWLEFLQAISAVTDLMTFDQVRLYSVSDTDTPCRGGACPNC